MNKYKKGKIIKGTVTGIEPYGVFVAFDEFYSGLIHISEISHGFVKNINDFVNIGDNIYTEIIDVTDDDFQLKLSIKNIPYKKGKISYEKRVKIVETSLGFDTLNYKLPIWINENIKKIKKQINHIDK